MAKIISISASEELVEQVRAEVELERFGSISWFFKQAAKEKLERLRIERQQTTEPEAKAS